MPVMTRDTPLAVIWRRRTIVLVTLLVFVLTTAVVSKTLNKVYSTDSTLLIALPADAQTFDTVQASQALARSYAEIINSPNLAARVARRLGGDSTKADILDATSFEPITETQLLLITAEDGDPARAKLIADTYADIFIDYAEANLTPTTQATISLADSAPIPRSAARPKPTLYTLVAAMLGLGIGLGLAFLRDRLDDRLRTPEEVEAIFDLPILARIPHRGRHERSVIAFKEAYRVLRTNLEFARTGEPVRSIAVTSGSEGEGKTTTVSELAMAIAEVGREVIVVEGDLRRPNLQRMLVDWEEPLWPGLSNYLVEAVPLDDAIHPTGQPKISIVPAGPLPPSPSALLESRRARELVAGLSERADVVLIDCPPLNIAADASVISRLVDGVIFLLDLSSSKEKRVRDGLRQLQAVKAETLGFVLNRDASAQASRYEYYYSATAQRSAEAEKV
jgi:capsular exopolysaccharide synthesis family protein